MLGETVDGQFTTLEDVAEVCAVLRGVPIGCAHRPISDCKSRLVDAIKFAFGRWRALVANESATKAAGPFETSE